MTGGKGTGVLVGKWDLKSVGEVSESGVCRQAFLYERLAVIVQPWLEHAVDGDEIGARVEIQEFAEVPGDNEFEAYELIVSRPIWRADLFRLSTGVPGNFDRAHYHPRFEGRDPGDRSWDTALKRDPLEWLALKLSDLDGLLVGSGHSELTPAPDARRLIDTLPGVLCAVKELLDGVGKGPDGREG
jgi:hypothetical protein